MKKILSIMIGFILCNGGVNEAMMHGPSSENRKRTRDWQRRYARRCVREAEKDFFLKQEQCEKPVLKEIRVPSDLPLDCNQSLRFLSLIMPMLLEKKFIEVQEEQKNIRIAFKQPKHIKMKQCKERKFQFDQKNMHEQKQLKRQKKTKAQHYNKFPQSQKRL
jgi:hypothetical protein